jgi:hypothetical protein
VNVVPITPTTPACFGVACAQHSRCGRYLAIESVDSRDAIATCDDRGDGARPLFVEAMQEQTT